EILDAAPDAGALVLFAATVAATAVILDDRGRAADRRHLGGTAIGRSAARWGATLERRKRFHFLGVLDRRFLGASDVRAGDGHCDAGPCQQTAQRAEDGDSHDFLP